MKIVALKENHLFGKAYAKGKKYVAKTVSVYVLRDFAAQKIRKNLMLDRNVNRYGISTSKKLGGAVQRNRARRVVKAGLCSVLEKYDVKGGNLVVLSVRGAAVDLKSTDAEKDILAAFTHLRLIGNGENTAVQ
ncbi:MAG: ribonuclease P protein component [Clostridia bacterium]|nr:ribonuclease P protein component [Clostridia bacterium]